MAAPLIIATRHGSSLDAHNQYQGQSCVRRATDISVQIGQMNSARAACLFSPFPEPTRFPEGLCHASDRSPSACLCFYLAADIQAATIWFVLSLAALIGVSLLLAGL